MTDHSALHSTPTHFCFHSELGQTIQSSVLQQNTIETTDRNIGDMGYGLNECLNCACVLYIIIINNVRALAWLVPAFDFCLAIYILRCCLDRLAFVVNEMLTYISID